MVENPAAELDSTILSAVLEKHAKELTDEEIGAVIAALRQQRLAFMSTEAIGARPKRVAKAPKVKMSDAEAAAILAEL